MVRSGEIVSRDNPKLSFYANTVLEYWHAIGMHARGIDTWIDCDSSVVEIRFYPLLVVLDAFWPIFSLVPLLWEKSNRRWIGRCTVRRMWNSVHSVTRCLFDSFSSEFLKFSNSTFFSWRQLSRQFLGQCNLFVYLSMKIGEKSFVTFFFFWITDRFLYSQVKRWQSELSVLKKVI